MDVTLPLPLPPALRPWIALNAKFNKGLTWVLHTDPYPLLRDA